MYWQKSAISSYFTGEKKRTCVASARKTRSIYDSTGPVLAILYREVPICFLQNISQIGPVVLEKKSFK